MYSFHVSIFGLIVSVIVMMVLGMLWYSPILFGKKWMKLVGMTPEIMAQNKKGASKAYSLMLIPAIVESYVLGVFMNNLFVLPTIKQALLIAFFAWLGFIATTMSSEYIFNSKPKPWMLYLINAGYQLVGLLLISIVLYYLG